MRRNRIKPASKAKMEFLKDWLSNHDLEPEGNASFLFNLCRETDKAVCVDIINNAGNIILYSTWLPKSQIQIDYNKNKVTIPEWLRKKYFI